MREVVKQIKQEIGLKVDLEEFSSGLETKLDKQDLYNIFPKQIEPLEWLKTMVRQEAAIVQNEIIEKLHMWD